MPVRQPRGPVVAGPPACRAFRGTRGHWRDARPRFRRRTCVSGEVVASDREWLFGTDLPGFADETKGDLGRALGRGRKALVTAVGSASFQRDEMDLLNGLRRGVWPGCVCAQFRNVVGRDPAGREVPRRKQRRTRGRSLVTDSFRPGARTADAACRRPRVQKASSATRHRHPPRRDRD